MANKCWVRQNYVKPDDTEKQLLIELEQLKSSVPYNASAIDRQRRKSFFHEKVLIPLQAAVQAQSSTVKLYYRYPYRINI